MRDVNRIPSNSVDLIYLDPPFNSKKNYNYFWSKATGVDLPEEEIAFFDTWKLDAAKEEEIRRIGDELLSNKEASHDDIKFWQTWIDALRHTNPQILAYLVFMAQRLWVMKAKLKDTGSIYVHCDPTASHYIKVLMDGIFGHKNFRNEIVWCYSQLSAAKSYFPRKHDTIFFYSKTSDYYFNPDAVRVPYAESTKERFNHANPFKGREKARLNEAGKIPPSWWTDIPIVVRSKTENTGYPTQKPIKLLERIINASCPPGGVVLDPFCGCGTTIMAAEKLNRGWIGIDICYTATMVLRDRLTKNYGSLFENGDKTKPKFKVDGIPQTMEQVHALIHTAQESKNEGRFLFQSWAIERVVGIPSLQKSGDGGIDGSIYFYKDVDKKERGRMVLSVKSDKKLQISYIRDLIGTMENNKAEMAGLICYARPTDGMYAEAVRAGYFEWESDLFADNKFPKVQILTVEEILQGKAFKIPPLRIGKSH